MQGQQALAIGDGFVQALLGVVMAQDAGLQGGVDVGGFDPGACTGAAQRCAFDGQGLGVGKQGALAALVVGFAVGLLQHTCHGPGRKVGQAALLAGVGDEHSRGLAGFGRGAKGFGKVHLDPKTPRHLGVGLLQGVILFDRADQHDLDLHVHRLGLQ